MRIIYALTFFCMSWPALAKGAKSTCSGREIGLQDCELRSGSYVLRLLPETIAWNDSYWRSVHKMPLSGEGTSWEKVKFEILDGQPVLQLWVWDKAQGENQIQSLNWYITTADEKNSSVIATGVVRKRRQKPQAAPKEGESAKSTKPQYLYDQWESHGLKRLKDGHWEMTVGRQKRILKLEKLEP